MRQYKQLTKCLRCQIYALLQTEKTHTEIAAIVGVHKSTLSRELKRNTGQKGYRYQQADNKAKKRRHDALKALKMTPEAIFLIKHKITEKWSPEQISGWLLKEQSISLSHERIYQYVWSNKATGGDLYTHLRCQGKKYNKRRHGKTSI